MAIFNSKLLDYQRVHLVFFSQQKREKEELIGLHKQKHGNWHNSNENSKKSNRGLQNREVFNAVFDYKT